MAFPISGCTHLKLYAEEEEINGYYPHLSGALTIPD
jgi:hypothetical protein